MCALIFRCTDQTEIPVSAVIRPPLPPTNLYFLSITRIHDVKHGPFHEHSSQLFSIATGVQHWHKVNSGLFKMYEVSPCQSGARHLLIHPLGGGIRQASGCTAHSPRRLDRMGLPGLCGASTREL